MDGYKLTVRVGDDTEKGARVVTSAPAGAGAGAAAASGGGKMMALLLFAAVVVVGGVGVGLGVGLGATKTPSPSSPTASPTMSPLWTQQGPKLFGSGSTFVQEVNQGSAVALSADGNTAIVGGSGDAEFTGKTWMFVRSGSSWSQQGVLVGTGYEAVGLNLQGTSVSVSASGDTAVVGGSADNLLQGATWVFVRSAGTWSQQGSKLVGTGISGSFAEQGTSVAIAATTADTIVVGGPSDNSKLGAVWIFVFSASTWVQQGSKLTPTGQFGTVIKFGTSVAISGNGNTVAVGGPGDSVDMGAVWIFTRTGSTWAQQGSKLFGTGSAGTRVLQGSAVALSADGDTVISGAPDDGDTTTTTWLGATWVFTRTGSVWTQQGSKLIGTGYSGLTNNQGGSVSLSADGNTAAVGAMMDSPNGAVWVFVRSGGVWSQHGGKVVGTGAVGNSHQGGSVALSGDGQTLISGGSYDDELKGASWVFTRNF